MKTYDISRLPSSIALGWDGENNWRPIAFDCSALLAGHSDGVVTLWLLPKGAAQAFPVALERDGNTVTWTPLSEEMTAEHGQLQITVQDGTDVGKSKVVDYTVHDSLVSGADHPAENPSWATQVVEDVTEATSHYPRIVGGNWYVWDVSEQEWVDTGVAAGGGDISPEDIAEAVEDYFDEHPITETDPTVPTWAKNPTKPTYTAAEVHALPDSTAIPTKTSDLQNDSGFLTQHQSLAAYRTASAQDAIDAAQDTAIAGKYTKPSTGIPASDLAADVQTSLGKADTALQSHQSLSGYATEQWVGQQGYQTAQQVQTAIAAIPDELPSGGSTGDFLRKTASGVAWETVPAAESASFGGGA